MIRGLKRSVPPPTFWEGRGAEDGVQSPMATDTIGGAYVMKLCKSKDKVHRAPELGICGDSGKVTRSCYQTKPNKGPSA